MSWPRVLSRLVFFISFWFEAEFLENGVARTPPMGWMSWGHYECAYRCYDKEKCLNEALIMEVADRFNTEGYQEAGYEYIIIDDCWLEKQRDVFGNLVPNKKNFPRGMKFLADYIHSKGLKFGMYTNIGKTTCEGFPASYGNFERDANQFAAWEIDYLKVDGCFVTKDFLDTAYIDLGKALNNTGRPIVYSCSWPYYLIYIHNEAVDYDSVSKYCNLWRNYHDIKPNYGNLYHTINNYRVNNRLYLKYHGPGHWNDPDMLLIGTEMLSFNDYKVQYVLYALLSAPILLSCDMKRITAEEKELLLNMDIAAIARDPLGKMARTYQLPHDVTLWVKPHIPIKGDEHESFSFALTALSRGDIVPASFKPYKYGAHSDDNYTLYHFLESSLPVKNVSSRSFININVPPRDLCGDTRRRPMFSSGRLPAEMGTMNISLSLFTVLL